MMPADAIEAFIAEISFNSDGLITTVAQDATTNEILMLAWQNEESLRQTLATGEMVYYSRSRQRLWHKGESSGNTQSVVSIATDCDGDALVAFVEQRGGIACHTGRKSCFYKSFSPEQGVVENAPVLKDPKTMYS